MVVTAIIFAMLGDVFKFKPAIFLPLAGSLGVIAGTIFIIAYTQQKVRIADTKIEIISNLEKRVIEQPKETKAAWELAQIKLESYLDRNISQVRSIYVLTVLVMFVGFSLVIIGVCSIYRNPTNLSPAILSSASGIVVSFIGATFLVVYRSTMEQARSYVTTLERINAVGMAVQILDNLNDSSGTIRDPAMVQVSQEILAMYRSQK